MTNDEKLALDSVFDALAHIAKMERNSVRRRVLELSAYVPAEIEYNGKFGLEEALSALDSIDDNPETSLMLDDGKLLHNMRWTSDTIIREAAQAQAASKILHRLAKAARRDPDFPISSVIVEMEEAFNQAIAAVTNTADHRPGAMFALRWLIEFLQNTRKRLLPFVK